MEQLAARALRVLAGGVSSDVRRPTRESLFARGEGPYVWDVGGQRFIDYVLGQGPLLLGHCPEAVLRAVEAQLHRGWVFAAEHELAVQVAEVLCASIPCAESVRFNTTGSEAVHAALRLARACTGRPLVVKFDGHYHGWLDGVLWGAQPDAGAAAPPWAAQPQSDGLPAGLGTALRVLPWNDLGAVRGLLEREGERVAAVICEPVMCNTGCIEPQPGFLRGLRQLCDRWGSLLIFDEVITGFRLAPGGAQQFYQVTPDLAVLGKALGAGMPVSALVGRRRWMERLGDGGVTHAGTFNSHPVCLAAASAALAVLGDPAVAAHAHLFEVGGRLRDGINRLGRAHGLRAYGPGPMFQLAVDGPADVRDARDAARADRAALLRLVRGLAAHGVRVLERGLVYVSLAHTAGEVDATLEALDAVLGSR